MDVNEAKERIKKKYLEETKKIYQKDERILFFKNLLKESEENNLDAYSEYFRGYLEWLKKKYGKSVKHFNKSIALDESLTYPWNGLGNVYNELKEYEKAIECYKKALDIDKDYAFPWHGLGIVYKELKEYEKAIECYKKSIDIDKDFASPWNGLGNVYYDLKEYEKAIECCKKAISIDNNNPFPRTNLGLIFKELNEYEKAESAFKKSLELFDIEKDDYWISMAKGNLKNIKQLLQSQKILKKKREVKHPDNITKVLNATRDKGIEQKALENKKSFLSFLDEKSESKEKKEDYFQVLRRWNSYTPIIADNYYISKGGGYFLRFGGRGIVIDPGFNFIDNFKGAGHLFDEIDAVLVSHAHNDHTADLESILTLLYKFNKEIKDSSDTGKDTIRKEIAKRKECDINKVSSDEIEEEFLKSPRRKIIDFYMTHSVFKKFSGLFELSSKKNYKIHIIEEGEIKKLNDSISFEVTAAKHRDIISDIGSVGFVIDVGDSVLIYTGDTGWSDKVEENYKKIAKKYKDKYKLLVAHLGGLKETEIIFMNEESDRKEAFYPNHLGRLGLVIINEVVIPGICFISEFGEELKDFRIEIAKIFQEAFENKILFFPADIGLTFDLKTKTIEAVTGVSFKENKLKRDYVIPEEIETCLLRKDYSLHYFKKNWGFTESDLTQVLREKFDQSNR